MNPVCVGRAGRRDAAHDDDPLSLQDSIDGVVRSMQGGERTPERPSAGDGGSVRALE